MKKYRLLIIVCAGLLAIASVSLKISERIIIRKVSSLSKNAVTIGSVTFSLPPAIKLRKINIAYARPPYFSFREINIRRAFTGSAFAFSGPGDMVISNQKREVSVKGSISGNFKDGTLTINPTSIIIADLGSFKAKGLLENWGKESFTATIELGGTEIKEINKLFDIKIPFNGKATGTVMLNFAGEKEKNIRFDVTVNDLSTEEKGSEFTAFIKGMHNIIDGRTNIADGKLLNKKGGQIFFKGFIDRENFNLNFETENLPLEEFLKLIPEETRIKYNLSIPGGSASMKNFNIERVKKKSGLRAHYLSERRSFLS